MPRSQLNSVGKWAATAVVPMVTIAFNGNAVHRDCSIGLAVDTLCCRHKLYTQHTSLHRAARTNTLKLEYSEQQSETRA